MPAAMVGNNECRQAELTDGDEFKFTDVPFVVMCKSMSMPRLLHSKR